MQDDEKSTHNGHYRFVQNTKCEYFPCHKVLDTEEFNCLFCFCPLYWKDDCGGKYKLLEGFKDCSDCSFPPKKKN